MNVKVADIVECDSKGICQHAGELGLSCTRRSVDQNVDTWLLGFNSLPEIPSDHSEILIQMRIVFCCQVTARRWHKELAYERCLAVIFAEKMLGQTVVQIQEIFNNHVGAILVE